MTNTNLENIIKKGENEQVEFKTGFNNDVIISLTAFANTKGGKVIVGVNNSRNITGIAINHEKTKDWVNEIKQKTSPALIPDIEIIEVNNKNIVILSVGEFPVKPVSMRGRYYKRSAASNQQLTADEIVEMRYISLNYSFDSFTVESKLTDIDKDALNIFIKRIDQSGRFKSSGNALSDFEKLGFIKNGKLTRAAELLFGTHHTALHIGRFKSPDHIIDDTMIRSPLIIAVEEAMDFIKKNISLGYEFTGELQRKDRWQYPLPVLRELLLNAVIHRDYRNPTDIIIKIFDERIEFSNPGGLFGDLTVKDLLTDSYQAKHRNRLLSEAFYLMGEVEKYGTGFIRIRKHLEEYPELLFDIIDLKDFFKIILLVNKDVTDDVTDDVTEKRLNKIIELIKRNNKISTKEIGERIGISKRTVLRDIEKLKKQNKLNREGSEKGGYWKVNE